MEGTQGRIPGGVHLVSSAEDVSHVTVRDPSKVAYVTQTTLSVDDTRDIIEALRRRFPDITGPDVKDICYATQNRQHAVPELAARVDMLLVVGARNSSNSDRLREIGSESGIPSYLIDDAQSLDPAWLEGVVTVGVTAGASAPEKLVQDLIDRLGDFGTVVVEELAREPKSTCNSNYRVSWQQPSSARVNMGKNIVAIPAMQQLRVGAYILGKRLRGVENIPGFNARAAVPL